MNNNLILRKCNHCGALIEVVKDCHCEDCGIMCCNEPMQEVTINDKEASFEKHIPHYNIKDGQIIVTINHVMEEDHYIEMIEIKNENETFIKKLKPNEAPTITYPYKGTTTIYSYCNKHGLWKIEIEKEGKNG